MQKLFFIVIFLLFGCDATPVKVRAKSLAVNNDRNAAAANAEPTFIEVTVTPVEVESIPTATPTIIDPTPTEGEPTLTPTPTPTKVAEGFLINEGAATAASRMVALTIIANTDATQMKISESSVFSGREWQPISKTMNYTFDTEGTKILYVKFADSNNVESAVFENTIVVDLFADSEGTFTINDAAAISSKRSVALNISLPANADKMMFCESKAFAGCAWENKATTKNYTFASDGKKNLYVKYKDNNAFESSSKNASITVDSVPPVFTVTNDVVYATDANITLKIMATDATAMLMKVAASVDFATAAWETYTATKKIPNTSNIKIQLKDAAGLLSSITDLAITSVDVLSLARHSLAATTVSTKAIFSGGYTDTNITNVVDIYDSVGKKWSAATLSQARGDLAATTANNKAYFAGGWTSGAVASNVVDIYDATNNKWLSAKLNQARRGIAATTVINRALFAGGDLGTSMSDVIDIFDTSVSLTFSIITHLSKARAYLAATSVANKAIFAGGRLSGDVASDVVDILDTNTMLFYAGKLSQARWSLGATNVGTKAILAGGFTKVLVGSSVVEIYDSANNTWSLAALSQARGALTAITVGTKAIFAGGFTAGTASNVVDIYDSVTNKWSTATLSQARGDLTATVVGTKVIFAGGWATSNMRTVDIYDSASNTWSTSLQ